MTRALCVTLVGLVVLVVACAKTLGELEPYPCATDGSCPDGRACDPEGRCVRARIDSSCRAGETDCTTAAPGGRCALGVCGQPCDGTRLTCPDGRVCTVAVGAGGDGACLKPCEDAGECPPHLTCRQLDVRDGKVVRACVSPTEKSSLGASCKNTSDCTAQGAALECFAGICTLPCRSQSDCGAGFLCPAGGGGCLRDCTTDTTVCDADQSCTSLWRQGLRACTGKDVLVPACESVKGLFVCGGLCGQPENNRVECDDGFCPTASTCGSNLSCECASARQCGPNGRKCTPEQPCRTEPWWCEPTLSNIGCNDDVSRVFVACNCKDGRVLASPCGSTTTCEARCRDECDVIGQDCNDPSKGKCTSVLEGSNEHDKCVPLPSAPKKENEPCTRFNSEARGWDDCDKGLFCSRVRAESGKEPELRCRRFCVQGGACPEGQLCGPSRWSIDERSDLAVCRTRCTFPDGTECGPGARCLSDNVCFSVDGSRDVDAFCRVEADCKAPLVCDLARNRCVPWCAPGHPCPPGYTCPSNGGGGDTSDAGADGGGTATTTVSACVKDGT